MTTRVSDFNDAPPTETPGVKDTAKEEGKAIADTARTETSRLASEARRELRGQSEAQTTRLAGGVRDLGQQLHRLASGEGPAEGPVADLVRQAAGRADTFAARLESRGVDGVASDVKQFARSHPGAYLAGAFAIGIVAGRMFRNADTRALVDAARPDTDSGTDTDTWAQSTLGVEPAGSVRTSP